MAHHSGSILQLHSGEASKRAAQLAGQSRGTTGGCTRTGGGCAATTARAYCGGAASWWNAALRVAATRVVCGVGDAWSLNILKRQLIHVGAVNSSLIVRPLLSAGTLREWRNRGGMVLVLACLWPTPRGAPELDRRGRNRNLPRRTPRGITTLSLPLSSPKIGHLHHS